MNIFYKIYARTFQKIMHFAMYFIGIKEPFLFKGYKVSEKIPFYLKNKYKYKKALIITDKNLYDLGLLNGLCSSLEENELKYEIFYDVVPNPTISNIESAKMIYDQTHCDFIIAFGGGSVIDVAKIVGALKANPKKDVYKLKGLLKVRKKYPLTIAIPTTAGTGSEATVASVIIDDKTREKFVINDPKLIPTIAVLDSSLILGLPKNLLITTALDALTHSIESYIGKSRTKKSKFMAEESIKLIFNNLEKFVDDRTNVESANNLLLASYYAGVSFTRSYVGYVHALSHAISGKYNSAHGYTNSILLPIVLRQYDKSIYNKLSTLSKQIFKECISMNKKDASYYLIEKIEYILDKYNIVNEFKNIIKNEDLDELVEHAYKESNPLYPVPKIYNKKQLKQIYQKLIV